MSRILDNLRVNGSSGATSSFTVNNNALVVTYGNKVGIGIEDPVGLLDVNGTSYFRGDVSAEVLKCIFFPATNITLGSGIDYKSRGEFGIAYTSHKFDTYDLITTTGSNIAYFANGGNIKMLVDKDGNVGINSTNPTTKLHIVATQSGYGFRLVDTTEGINKVLTSDANGVGTWASVLSIPGVGTTNKSVDTRGFTASVTETITHNLNSNSVIVQNYDSTGLQIIAGSVLITGTGSIDITFSQTLSSVKTVIIG